MKDDKSKTLPRVNGKLWNILVFFGKSLSGARKFSAREVGRARMRLALFLPTIVLIV